jgi:hypothetical protein
MKRRMLAAALLTAALAAPVAQANHRDDFVKEPTAVGRGGAAGTATRSTRRWRRPACSA